MAVVGRYIMVVPIIYKSLTQSHPRRKLLYTLGLCNNFIRFFLLPFSRYLHSSHFIYYYYNDFSFHYVLAYFISREMRPNGNLYFPPFPEQSYMPEIHAASYKCALENPLGRIVSRESRIKAGTDLCKYLIFVSAPKPPPTIIRTCSTPNDLTSELCARVVNIIISFVPPPPPIRGKS